MSLFSDIGTMISGAVQTIENVAMTALEAEFAPLEIAQSVANLATQALGQAMQSALQQLQQAGMPNFLANDIQQLINDVMQQLQNPTNPATDSYVNQQAGNQINNLAQSFANSILQSTLQNQQSGGSNGSGGWLIALAKALGKLLDQEAQKLQNMSNAVQNSNNPGQVTQLQAESQLFKLMMDTFSNVIKTIGEGLAGMASKQ